MKDKELEKAFSGYFEGINTPDNLTQDAKKQVKKRPGFWTSFAKYASAAASFVLVVAVGAVLLSRANLSDSFKDDGEPALLTYSDEQLTKTAANAYTVSEIDESLKFIEKLVYNKNASVGSVEKATFGNGETAHVRAEISLVTDTRYDAEIYVEFAEYAYAPLAEYAGDNGGKLYGINYCLLRTTDEKSGELLTVLYAKKGGVKYYFSVLSSDYDSYIKCLELIS